MIEQPTSSRTPTRRDPHRAPDEAGLRDRPVIRDILYALAFMFVAGALIALVYRFPVPFGAPARGVAGTWDAILATLVYGLAGGFIVVPLLAAGAGALLRGRGFPHHGPAAAIPPFLVAVLSGVALTLIIG